MAVTKISVQQLSDELFKLVGRNYLFINKENITSEAEPIKVSREKLLNADKEIPSWKEVKILQLLL